MPHAKPPTMRRILLLKTSSLGDVVHNLPVVSDIRAHYPHSEIDWVAEENFAPIPRLHAGVDRVIPVALRRWRRSPLCAATRDACCAFLKQLRAREYDAIVDTQGLLKSALITCAARGAGYGLDWKSSREPLRLFYQRTYAVPWGQHAVARNRSLAAQALGYTLTTPADFGLADATKRDGDAPKSPWSWLPVARYAVLLHATSAAPKLWPESDWIKLSNYLFLNNIIAVMPWGNAAERGRSERLASAMKSAVVAPALTLSELAQLLGKAQVVVGVDTGLTHLAAAFNVPTVGIYCATDAAATGIHACPRALNLGGVSAPPAVSDVIAGIERLLK